MIECRTDHEQLSRCEVQNVSCTKQATIDLTFGKGDDAISHPMCLSCAREIFTALGFIIVSQTGESIERLVGLKKRKGDKGR